MTGAVIQWIEVRLASSLVAVNSAISVTLLISNHYLINDRSLIGDFAIVSNCIVKSLNLAFRVISATLTGRVT